MESSEDDAGGAANASRRASAREKDTSGSECSGSNAGTPLEATEPAAAVETASMSEFDADSVPSPSQDVNTSTEAILDMIDEIVEGPDAVRRCSRHSDDHDDSTTENSEKPLVENQDPIGGDTHLNTHAPASPAPAPSLVSETDQQDPQTSQPPNTTSAPIDSTQEDNSSKISSACVPVNEKPESPVQQSLSDEPQECISGSEQLSSEVGTKTTQENNDASPPPEIVQESQSPVKEEIQVPDTVAESSQASSSLSVTDVNVSSLSEECSTNHSAEPPSDSLPSIATSSVSETVESGLDTTNSEVCERTINSATSSDSRENVTVESAESTSSDNYVSDTRTVAVESSTRSPLRRRLVRPTICDRRSDSTVSSTVDTQVVSAHMSEQVTSDCIAKDVSSSSDSLPPVYGNIKPEEISNVSEISVCKAETSAVSTPKKIKLVRQKVTPPAHKDNTPENPIVHLEQCQSTSSENTAQSLPDPGSTNSMIASTVDTESTIEGTKESADVPPLSNEEVCPEATKRLPSDESSKPQAEPILIPSSSEQKDTDEKDEKRVPPIKLNLSAVNSDLSHTKPDEIDAHCESSSSIEASEETSDSSKQVPKLTIKLCGKQVEDVKSPIPKLTIKPIKPPSDSDTLKEFNEPIPSVTKLNIKPIPKPAEKLNDVHRKSSSNEISESESSENDDSNSTSDQASASDQGSTDVVPKVTIKLGKPGTESEGKFYTEAPTPKLTRKVLQHNDDSEQESITKLKVMTSQSEGQQAEKVPKLTIKTVTKKTEGQPLSPKLTIKPIKPPDNVNKELASEKPEHHENTKLKLTVESGAESKDSGYCPKITIKPVLKTDESTPKSPKLNIKPIVKPPDNEVSETDNSTSKVPSVSRLNIKALVKPTESCDTTSKESNAPVVSKLIIKPLMKSEDKTDIIPVVSKLNIKPIIKPSTADGETASEDEEKVPVVSKINIKPVLRPKSNEVDESIEEVPKITKLNIKPIKEPEVKYSVDKDCDEMKADFEKSIPIVTKINIKPVVKPTEEETSKDSENQSSETGNSSDDNTDDIPVVPKLIIKPIIKPHDLTDTHGKSSTTNEDSVPVVTKLNIKPLVKPEENEAPVSPKKVTKLNIKPIIKPDESNESDEAASKHPPLVMKINMKAVSESPINDCGSSDKKVNSIDEIKYSCNTDESLPKISKQNTKSVAKPSETQGSSHSELVNCNSASAISEILKQNCIDISKGSRRENSSDKTKSTSVEPEILPAANRQQSSLQNCTLLKKLLETKKDGLDKRLQEQKPHSNHTSTSESQILNLSREDSDKPEFKIDLTVEKTNDHGLSKTTVPDHKEPNESLTKPLEISISEKYTNQSSGQDSPRIILKINKTDHGSSAKIITEDLKRPEGPLQKDTSDNTQEVMNDKQNLKKNILNSRKKPVTTVSNESVGKRLRSSRIVETPEKIPPVQKKYAGKRPSATEISPNKVKETELSVLETKRIKLGQLLSNKNLTITAIPSKDSLLPATKPTVEMKQEVKAVNHTLLNNQNCSKNGNSKLHNILSNLHAKQAQALAFNDINLAEKKPSIPDLDSNSTGSSDVIEIVPILNSHPEVQQMIINENAETHDLTASDDVSQDPLEVDLTKSNVEQINEIAILTPQPKKRGRPRKLPLSEGAKIAPVVLPVPALEERPQRSLRLYRDRPAILVKTRGRGRGRGAKRVETPASTEAQAVEPSKFLEESKPSPPEIDPTSSRIKLPRMTEALDKMPSVCMTPLSSRRRSSSASEMKMFGDAPELKVVLSAMPLERPAPTETPTQMLSPFRGRGGRGSRGGRGRSPRGTPRQRGRGRGGGRGAMYMKETMGIYGRVCGPATTTVELFEEETCMMDDNATPAKPINLLDEDSISSVKSSTNESSMKMKKSKFADLFDSNKVWTAADVKEYKWPPPERPDVEHQVMMIQEQVAMFLGVKSFKRRYPELKRRAIVGEERDYVQTQGLVTEALCDLGITAVDASEVLDIMLSDYPHKYEEYRSHQHRKQVEEAASTPAPAEEPVASTSVAPTAASEEVKQDSRMDRIEMKLDTKPEPPKIDLEKTRQEQAAAAIASASEFNSRLTAARRSACVDLQSLTVLRRRTARTTVRTAQGPSQVKQQVPIHVRPPGGFYPHALLAGQYQHWYRTYTPEQLRYFPLNTVTGAPPAPPSPPAASSESEGSLSDAESSGGSIADRTPAKRKKLTKTKRASGETTDKREETKEGEVVDTCRACGLRLEANRKYTHERFLVCAHCQAKLHPGCVELSADTIRKCREYAWQCAECKSCCACRRPQDDDKMLFCDLCDRGFHIYCVGLEKVPSGRWHCVECAICKSCGARDPNGVQAGETAGGGTSGSVTVAGGGEWQHQTRRGPGGHKVYSHSLCTPCARAYRIGRYCPLCERSFIGPKGTMQLVICKLCDRQHHQDCVRQTVSQLNVLDYTCNECKRGGITSRAAAVRLAPRTIATLFMAKRRFNKYAHRQYLKSRLPPTPKPGQDSSTDIAEEESCEPVAPVDDASDVSEPEVEAESCDPLGGAEPSDEAAAAVAALQCEFGD